MPPPPLPSELNRVFSLLPRLASPRHLLQAHAFLLPRGGHHHPRLLSALLLASLRLARQPHAHAHVLALALLRRIHPSIALRDVSRVPRLCGSLGPQLHSQLLRAGLATSDAHVSASLVQVYCACGRVTAARTLFDEMVYRDVVAWNVMAAGYVKAGDLVGARELFDVMPERNVVSWTTVIGAYAQMKRPEEAVEVFRRMQVEGIEPDGVALLSVLSACSDLGAVDLGEWVHKFVVSRGLCGKIPLMNAIIDMYMKCGCTGKALEVFDGMEQKSVVTWTTLIAGFALHGLGSQAVEIFRRMERENVAPNDVTFLAILSACSHIGLTDLGRWYFNIMISQYKIKPRVEHYGCMVDLLGRAGCLMEAQNLVRDMPFKANAAIWGALLAAARTHGDADLGEQALLHLIELEPHNSGNYILLSNIYAQRERWNDVSKLRRAMKERGLRNVPGASSIEIGGRVHEFTCRDGSHPYLHSICEVLCEINANMKSVDFVILLPDVLHDIEDG